MINLNVALIQTDIRWHDIKTNLEHADKLISALKPGISLIVLPEMFTTGFTLLPESLAVDTNSETISVLKKLSLKTGADITASMIYHENGFYYNRLLWISPDGSIQKYNKHHLFRISCEHKIYTPGNKEITPSRDGWKIRPYICYDLRFPVWIRNKPPYYDVLLFTANWPESRQNQWEVLLRARAIENQCFVVGVNRTGIDGNGLEYIGGSAVFDFKGEKIIQADKGEQIIECSLEYEPLKKFREEYPFWMDADSFIIS